MQLGISLFYMNVNGVRSLLGHTVDGTRGLSSRARGYATQIPQHSGLYCMGTVLPLVVEIHSLVRFPQLNKYKHGKKDM